MCVLHRTGQKLCVLRSRWQYLWFEVDSINFLSVFHSSDALDAHPAACCVCLCAPVVGSSIMQLPPQHGHRQKSKAVAGNSPVGLTPLLANEIRGFIYTEKVSVRKLSKYFSCSFLLFFLACSRKKEKVISAVAGLPHLTASLWQFHLPIIPLDFS